MNQQLLEQVLRSPRLPSLPTIAIEVVDLVQQRDVNIRQIAHTISHDPALATKVLKTVNSSFYGLSQPVATITHALVILGLNSVKTLALGFSLVSNLKHREGDFDHMSFWKRSIFTAVAAKMLAKERNLVLQEEAFLGGLLQDLGLLAMSQSLGIPYSKILASAGNEHRKLCELEQAELQTDHAEVGAILAKYWKLPPVLVEPIRWHENPDGCTSVDLLEFVRCIALGNRVADVYMVEPAGAALELYFNCAQQWFEIARPRAQVLLEQIHKSTGEMSRLFELPTGPLGNAQEVLARANEALMQLSLQQMQVSTELEQRNRELAQEAFTDSLTDVANRRKFNAFVSEQFDFARQSTQPLSLLFLDADHFKKLNDTYGHPVGDRVLVEIASVLKRNVNESGLVARYGGEEFAMVLPNLDRPAAAQLAERVRQQVAESNIQTDDGREPVKVTVSIGVATARDNHFDRVEQLVKAADQGVYAAKGAGRNCVRVFAPRAAKVQQQPAA